MTVPDRLEVTVRACAGAAEDEAAFVRALRGADGVRVRPYFARGGTGTVAGYSVALRDSPAADGSPVWYGGGRLARDLTLPRLRADWPTSPEHTQAALTQWQSAHRNPTPAITEPVFDAQAWARCTTEVTALREQLRDVPIEDRDRWAWVARQTAGAFAAWSHQLEGDTPGPLAETARVLGRSAQLHAHQVRPQRAPGPSAGAATRLLAIALVGGQGAAAQRALMTQLTNTVKALHDCHRAAGDMHRANEIRDVVKVRLQHVRDALPAPTPDVAPELDSAAEAARVAGYANVGVRAPGSPVPGRLGAPDTPRPTRPTQRPGVRPSEEIER